MRLDETLRLKALQLKAVHSGQTLMETLGERALNDPEMVESLKLRQLCAQVSQELFAEVEGVCDLLSISKRAFITGALVDALERASAVLAEVKPLGEDS